MTPHAETPARGRRRTRWLWFGAGSAVGLASGRAVLAVADWQAGRSPGVHSLWAVLFAALAVALAVWARAVQQRVRQSYYWTPEWQAGERAAVAQLERGEGRRFENPADAIEWLTDGGERP